MPQNHSSLGHRPNTEVQGIFDDQDAPFLYGGITPVKSHRKHIICLLPQLSSYPFTIPSCTPSPPSAALIGCPPFCTTPQPRPFSGAHTANASTPFPQSQKGARGIEMEGVPYDWSDYLSREGLSDVTSAGPSFRGGQAGQDG